MNVSTDAFQLPKQECTPEGTRLFKNIEAVNWEIIPGWAPGKTRGSSMIRLTRHLLLKGWNQVEGDQVSDERG